MWLRAPWDEAKALQRLLSDGSLRIVLKGEKQDGDFELVNLAERASQPLAPLPLPLFAGEADWPEDASTIASGENSGRA